MKEGEESFSYGRNLNRCLLREKKRERWLKRKTQTRKNEQELKKKQNSNNNKEQESERQKKRPRACLHGGGGPQVGEVTRFGW